MKKNILLAIISFVCLPSIVNAMEKNNPGLPKEFYRGMYTEILAKLAECPEAKSGLQEFVDSRLKTTEEAFAENKPMKMSCETIAMLVSIHLSNYGRDSEASIISQYGNLVPELCAYSIRKKLGVRVAAQIPLETWELKQISGEEYAALLEKYYTPEDLQKAIVAEEIHAHKMLCELAGIKPTAKI